MLDDAAPALGAQLRVVERCLIGGTADSEIERLILRDVAPRLDSERAVRAEKILARHAAVVECQCAASSVATPFSPVLARTTNSAASDAPTTRSLPPLRVHPSPARTAAVLNGAWL